MIWVLGGYVWLYLHRPFEVWPFLGDLQVERLYALGMITFWLAYPGKKLPANRLHWAFLFFAVTILIGWTFSPYPNEAGAKIFEDFCKILIVYVLLVTSVHNEKSLRQLIIVYLGALALYEVHSLLEYLSGRFEYRMGIVRMKGVDQTFGDPNTFAATLLHALPFLVPFWLSAKRSQTKAVILAYGALSLLCIFLTGSRRAFVGVCFLVGVLLLRSRNRLLTFTLVLLSAPIVWSALGADLQGRFLTLIDSGYGPKNAQRSGMSRYYYFLDGIRLWNEHPVTGVGPGAFGIAAGHGMQSHNLYAQTMAELGSLGVISLLLMILGFRYNAKEINRLYKAHPWWEKDFVYYVGSATWLSVVLLLFMGFGGHNLFRYNWLWFGAFQVSCLGILRRRAAEIGRQPMLIRSRANVFPAYA